MIPDPLPSDLQSVRYRCQFITKQTSQRMGPPTPPPPAERDAHLVQIDPVGQRVGHYGGSRGCFSRSRGSSGHRDQGKAVTPKDPGFRGLTPRSTGVELSLPMS